MTQVLYAAAWSKEAENSLSLQEEKKDIKIQCSWLHNCIKAKDNPNLLPLKNHEKGNDLDSDNHKDEKKSSSLLDWLLQVVFPHIISRDAPSVRRIRGSVVNL